MRGAVYLKYSDALLLPRYIQSVSRSVILAAGKLPPEDPSVLSV